MPSPSWQRTNKDSLVRLSIIQWFGIPYNSIDLTCFLSASSGTALGLLLYSIHCLNRVYQARIPYHLNQLLSFDMAKVGVIVGVVFAVVVVIAVATALLIRHMRASRDSANKASNSSHSRTGSDAPMIRADQQRPINQRMPSIDSYHNPPPHYVARQGGPKDSSDRGKPQFSHTAGNSSLPPENPTSAAESAPKNSSKRLSRFQEAPMF
ncbi:hypothetical protein F5Y18DRAFT_271118 [Xylariaceae sp. FL1019]|nr:hypothetical protein F5Y18DRAFT_271118 [Xylariaceae sp. FL1019]